MAVTEHEQEQKTCELSVKVLEKQKFIRSVLNNDILSGINVSFHNETYLQQLGRALYVKARMALGVGLHEFKHQLVPYVLQSSCLGCSIASYMASVMYFSGFGAPLDEEKGSAYLLRSALLDDRLGLLSLGFKYYYGLNGYPVDMSIAWRYYVDAAWMFHDDREEHKESDVTTEIVRLTDKKTLEMYLGKESHYFQWLKMQASQGIESARQELSQMLFWGSKGVDRDTGAAVQYYRQLAQTGDSTGQFDLGIVMLRGQGGVKKNEDDGVSYLKRAADQGHQGAISALGWHYLVKRDYKFAYKYLKMAADRGNPDAMHNLGYMYENGFVHGSPKNNTASYLYFIDAAMKGQPDSALSLSAGQIYGDGIMLQNATSAAAWARNNAERLSAVGRLLQQGLKSFLKDKFSEALMFYMMAAETGVEVASFNMAYLCENEDASEIANSYIGAHCAYHYYNKSLNSFTPHSYAVNRVGDFYFFGCSAEQPSDIDKALEHYIWAAEMNDPQAFYNLAYIAQMGYHIVPELKKSHLHIPPNELSDHESLQFFLFSKCEELEIAADPENKILTPCAIAKYNWLLNKTYKSYKTEIQSATVIVILTLMILLCYFSVYKRGRYFTTPYMINSV